MFVDALKPIMATHENPGDYMENGVLRCGRCHTPKQALLVLPALTGDDTPRPFPVMCACEKERDDEERKKEETTRFLARMNSLCGNGVHDASLMQYTFSDDDGGQEKAVDVLKRYCEKWPEMLENNIGILLSGPVGTGKTFLASCIANDLLQRRVTVCGTSFSRIMNTLQSTFDGKQDVLDRLGRFQLLFLDDLGSERTTEFASEQVFSVIDARYRAKKPVIITTNLPLKDIENPQNMAYSRIFDRILEMCPVRLCIAGPSRRQGLAGERMALARNLLL